MAIAALGAVPAHGGSGLDLQLDGHEAVLGDGHVRDLVRLNRRGGEQRRRECGGHPGRDRSAPGHQTLDFASGRILRWTHSTNSPELNMMFWPRNFTSTRKSPNCASVRLRFTAPSMAFTRVTAESRSRLSPARKARRTLCAEARFFESLKTCLA